MGENVIETEYEVENESGIVIDVQKIVLFMIWFDH